MEKLSASQLGRFLECQEKWRLSYDVGRITRRSKGNALFFGSAWHDAMEVLYKNKEKKESDLHWADKARLDALLAGYEELVLPEDMKKLKPFAVENRFVVPSPVKGYAISGQFDLVFTDERDRIWVMEHKTTSWDISYGARYWDSCRYSYQSGIYLYALEKMGFDVAGVQYNACRKLNIKPKSRPKESEEDFRSRCLEKVAEDPERCFGREEFVYTDGERKLLIEDLTTAIKQIKHAKKNGCTRNRTACIQYFGSSQCEYFGVCNGIESIDDDKLFESRRPKFGESE